MSCSFFMQKTAEIIPIFAPLSKLYFSKLAMIKKILFYLLCSLCSYSCVKFSKKAAVEGVDVIYSFNGGGGYDLFISFADAILRHK